jgi:sigma-B regulation protein RsbU (phosphoserine phosphatase)
VTQPPRQTGFFLDYARDLKTDDLHRLFTRDTREAYHFFARHVDLRQFDGLPWYRRLLAQARVLFVAFTMRLSPARRAVYAFALVAAVVGLLNQIGGDRAADGTGWLLIAFALVNLLVLLEVADRLTLKNDLEVAREIQNAMLPGGTYRAPGVEVVGMTRPANTVGGDFYDIQPLRDGRVVIALGDVSGKGSPAALLMALLLAMFRTLVPSIEDENLEPSELASRLNVQVSRHAPGNRFITLFCGVFTPLSGELRYVSAGHPPPLLLRAGGGTDRLADGGIALGMFAQSTYVTGRALLGPGDLVAVYSDGITEAENPIGKPFDERGLETALPSDSSAGLADLVAGVVRAVEQHTGDVRFADDLTILLLRRSTSAAV